MNIGRRGFFGKMLGGAAAVAALPIEHMTAALPPEVDTFEADRAEVLRHVSVRQPHTIPQRPAAISLPRGTLPHNFYQRKPHNIDQPKLDHLVEDLRQGRFDRVIRLATSFYDDLTSGLTLTRVPYCKRGAELRVMTPRYTVDEAELTPAHVAELVAELPHDLFLEMEHNCLTYTRKARDLGFQILCRQYTAVRADLQKNGPVFTMCLYSEMAIFAATD